MCAACGSTRLKRLRLGTARAAEELAALVGEPVDEVSSTAVPREDAGAAGVLLGTEAVLHRARVASAVVFLDFDQELAAPRYRAWEEALGLLAMAGRLVGGRGGGGGSRPSPGTCDRADPDSGSRGPSLRRCR